MTADSDTAHQNTYGNIGFYVSHRKRKVKEVEKYLKRQKLENLESRKTDEKV